MLHFAASKKDLEAKRLVRVKVGRIPFVVVRARQGPRAYLAVCPHKDIAFGAKLAGGAIECPIHEIRFDTGDGRVRDARGRDLTEGLTPAEVIVDGDDVLVDVTTDHAERFKRAVRGRRASKLGRMLASPWKLSR